MYIRLRSTQLLPLPAPTTLRKLISSTQAMFGFNQLALDTMKTNLENLPIQERYGTLMWDELSIEKDLTWDGANLKWDGPVCYGGEVEEGAISDEIADHALMLVFQPFRSNWVQPFGIFATKSAAPADVLQELVCKAIVELYNHGAIVKACVSDGATTNKAALLKLGISGNKTGRCYTLHPNDNDIKIYFFTDVPHLVKCTRNHFMNHKDVYVSSKFKFRFMK